MSSRPNLMSGGEVPRGVDLTPQSLLNNWREILRRAPLAQDDNI
jgi:hypothetical protein